MLTNQEKLVTVVTADHAHVYNIQTLLNTYSANNLFDTLLFNPFTFVHCVLAFILEKQHYSR